jgi:ribose 5-phosphate isomerase B
VTNSKIALASDHAGFALKTELAKVLIEWGHDVVDLGTDGTDSVDYPDFGEKLAQYISTGDAQRGVLVCGTGIGISIAANRHAAIRAAVCHDVTSARMSRLHNDANVLALGERLIGVETAKDCLKVFLETSFEGGRHQRRVDKLSPPSSSR